MLIRILSCSELRSPPAGLVVVHFQTNLATPRDRVRHQTLLTFAEPVVVQRNDGTESLRFIRTVGLDLDLTAEACGQHHHAHDALGIDAAPISAHVYVANESPSQLGQLGRRAGVQAQLIADFDGGLLHRDRQGFAWFWGLLGLTCIAP